MINRQYAQEILEKYLKNANLLKHSLAVGAVMEALAEKFDQNIDKWFITGLLHDIDYEQTENDPEMHGIVAMNLLENIDLDDDMKYAIKSHSGNFERISLIDKSLWTADAITGLITASALVRPDKLIENIKLKSLKKKFKTKKFAAGANREQIKDCSQINLELEEFMQISILAMSKYQDQII